MNFKTTVLNVLNLSLRGEVLVVSVANVQADFVITVHDIAWFKLFLKRKSIDRFCHSSES